MKMDPCPVSITTYVKVQSGEAEEQLVRWFAMTRGFVSIVSNKPPYGAMRKFINGDQKLDSTEKIVDLLKEEEGFMACFIFAIVFIICMLLSFLCVCSCRCFCGNCSGGKYQRKATNIRCRRQIYIAWLFICLVGISIGLANSILTIEKGLKSVNNSKSTVLSLLGNVQTFTGNTTEDVHCLMKRGVSKIINETRERMNDIKENEGKSLALVFKKHLAVLNETNDNITNYSSSMNENFKMLESFLQNMNESIIELDEERNRLIIQFRNISNLCHGEICKDPCTEMPGIFRNITFPKYSFGEIYKDNSDIEKMNKVVKEFVAHYEKLITNVDKIPIHIEENSKNIRNDIEIQLKYINERNSGNNQDSLGKMKKKLDTLYRDTKSIIEKNFNDDQNFSTNNKSCLANWVLKLSLLLIFIPTLLWFLGLICGILGHGDDHYTKPTHRGCLSNCGGRLLMLGTYIFFFFSCLTMIVLTIVFQVGGHAQVYVCEPLLNDSFEILDQFYSFAVEKSNNSILKGLKPSEVLKNCKDNKSIVQALKLNKEVETELDKKVDLTKRAYIVSKLENIEFYDFTNFLVEFEKNRNFLKEVKFNYTTNFVNECEDIKTVIDDYDEKKMIIERKLRESEMKKDDETKNLIENLMSYKDQFTNLSPSQNYNLSVELINSLNSTKETIDNVTLEQITEDLKDAVKEAKRKYVNETLKPNEKYVETVRDKLNNEIAKCGILWETFDVGRNVLCRDILDPFNGYWFSLGWCLFFQFFALVAAIKLSKHFYRMTYETKEDIGYLAYNGYNGRDLVSSGSGHPITT